MSAELRLIGVAGNARSAHDGVTLSVAPGEITAILGLPGSGKSALMARLAGTERGRGTIELNNRPVTRIAPHRRGFGTLFQQDALFPGMTLAENIALPLRLRGSRKSDRRRLTDQMLDAFQLAAAAHLLPQNAPPALRRRAMLARAMVANPLVLLLDEPAAEEPPSTRLSLIASLRRIHAVFGTTTLLATSSPADAMAAADRIAVLRLGAVVQHASAEEVFNKPADAAVAALLGESNCLPGTIVDIDEDQATLKLDCGVIVEAEPRDAFQAGDRCLLTIRPERIAIAAANAAGMGDHAIDATVLDVHVMGETCRLRLLIGSGAEIVVSRPAAAGLRGLAPGRRASLAWQPHQAAVFRQTPG